MKNVLTLILGGGAGTRLYPLTKYRAKPAVPLAGKYRLIDVSVSNCINSNLRRIYVLTQYLSASLNRHVSQSYAFDQFSQGSVDILAAEQRAEDSSWFQGTADAVRKHWLTMENHDCNLILVLPGDALYRMDYAKMVRQHRETGAEITVAVNTVPQRVAHHFGLLRLEEDSSICEFREKPKTREGQAGLEAPPAALEKFGVKAGNEPIFLASMGAYLFNRDVLHRWMTETDHIDFGKQIIPESITRNKVYGYIFDGYWEDIGTIDAFYKAHMDFLEPDPPFRFADPVRPIYTRPRFLPNTRVPGQARVAQSVVTDGCSIGSADIRKSIIGLRSVIGDGSKVDESILMGADFYDPAPVSPWENIDTSIPLGIGKDCVVRRAILDKNVRIGDGVRIVNEKGVENADGEFHHIREGIVIIPKNVAIPHGTVI